MKARIGIAGLVLAASAAHTQMPQVPPARTVQQDFDAATALDETGAPAARLAAWEALERRVAGNRRSRALMQLRKSSALLALDRKDEAVAAARAGLAGLPATDPSLREDRLIALMSLGRVAEAAVDYPSAADAYAQAEGLAQSPVEKLMTLNALIGVQTFTDPDRAAAAVARADAVLAQTQTGPKVQATFRRLNAERLLNRGDFAGARGEAKAAVRLLGGLTGRTDLDDVAARSDFAVAAMLGGDPDAAREYMAMTGAGRLPKSNFDPAVSMRVPDCGGEAGLKPQDMAVVEFSISDGGQVVSARPIYAAGGGAVAQEFARTALDWSWTPEQVKQLPPFFRYRTRVEMRCSAAFKRPSVGDFLDTALTRWLTDHDVAVADAPPGADVAALPAARAELAALEAKRGRDALALVPVLRRIAQNSVTPREEAHAASAQALTIAQASGMTGAPLLAIELGEWRSRGADGLRDDDWAEAAKAALAGRYARDAEARTAIRMILAQTGRGKPDRAIPYLQAVATDGGLAKGSALRAAALVQLASLEQAQGDVAAARAAFAKSGLSADQCSLVDTPPRFLGAGGTFPREAMQWGFEGWTLSEFDISAEGKVLNVRPVLSYPPFVFTKAGTQTIAGARYARSFRPDGGLGCGGSSQRVKFLMPG